MFSAWHPSVLFPSAVGPDSTSWTKGDSNIHNEHRALGKYPIIYRVEKLRDGKSYVTRYALPESSHQGESDIFPLSPSSVTASQNGQPIFMLTCSFTLPTPARFPQPSFREPMPLGIPPPLACQSEEERWSAFLASPRAAKLQPSSRHSLEAYVLERESSPVAIREVPRDVEFWFEDDDESEEKRRADKVEAKWDGHVAGKVNFAARARANNGSGSGDQSIKQVKRKMERHERMLWMKAKDDSVANLDTNFQKVCNVEKVHLHPLGSHEGCDTFAEYLGLPVRLPVHRHRRSGYGHVAE